MNKRLHNTIRLLILSTTFGFALVCNGDPLSDKINDKKRELENELKNAFKSTTDGLINGAKSTVQTFVEGAINPFVNQIKDPAENIVKIINDFKNANSLAQIPALFQEVKVKLAPLNNVVDTARAKKDELLNHIRNAINVVPIGAQLNKSISANFGPLGTHGVSVDFSFTIDPDPRQPVINALDNVVNGIFNTVIAPQTLINNTINEFKNTFFRLLGIQELIDKAQALLTPSIKELELSGSIGAGANNQFTTSMTLQFAGQTKTFNVTTGNIDLAEINPADVSNQLIRDFIGGFRLNIDFLKEFPQIKLPWQ